MRFLADSPRLFLSSLDTTKSSVSVDHKYFFSLLLYGVMDASASQRFSSSLRITNIVNLKFVICKIPNNLAFT